MVGAVQSFFGRIHLRALQPSSARSLQPPGLTSLHWPWVGRFPNTATQKPALVHNHSHVTTRGWSGSSVGENQGTMPPVISLNFDAPSANLDVISRIDLCQFCRNQPWHGRSVMPCATLATTHSLAFHWHSCQCCISFFLRPLQLRAETDHLCVQILNCRRGRDAPRPPSTPPLGTPSQLPNRRFVFWPSQSMNRHCSNQTLAGCN